MVPNFKEDGMVSLKSSQGVLWIIILDFIPMKNFWGIITKGPKLLGDCVQIPPRVMAKLALQIKYKHPKFQNRVWE